jgi:hypothetical protein
MEKSILSLEGVEVLSKNQMRNVGGSQKCVSTSAPTPTIFMQAGEAIAPCTVTYKCRPSFLGIGFGSWSEETSGPSWDC